uniref:Uncharacterized protein n=1 Tax=Amazona collaria TaxID=241587 RepID=A0A8B9J1J0_9PSIT
MLPWILLAMVKPEQEALKLISQRTTWETKDSNHSVAGRWGWADLAQHFSLGRGLWGRLCPHPLQIRSLQLRSVSLDQAGQLLSSSGQAKTSTGSSLGKQQGGKGYCTQLQPPLLSSTQWKKVVSQFSSPPRHKVSPSPNKGAFEPCGKK